MDGRKKQCRVCKVLFVREDLDPTGRCKGCRDAKTATDNHMTYGQMEGMRYAEKVKAEEDRLQRVAEAKKRAEERRKAEEIRCRNCGGVIPSRSREEGFCCPECSREYWNRKKREQERDEKLRQEQENRPAPDRFCQICAKPLTNQKLYCSYQCRYSAAKKEREEQKKREGRPERFCLGCGKKLEASRNGNARYCSPECQRAMLNERKRNKRRAQKSR